MATEIIPYTTRDAWLEARAQDVTSTEVAALFNASPYVTAFELFYAKRERVIEQRADNPRMRWRRRLQDPIAEGVAEDHGLAVRKMNEYIRDPADRVGSSFDFEIVTASSRSPFDPLVQEHGHGLMEIKTVDSYAFQDGWLIEDGAAVEAPPHIELQVQHQMLVSGMKWALLVAMIGGNRVSTIERLYDPALGAAILRKVREFWTLVDAGTPPVPDYTRDAERIMRLHLEATAGKVIDARADEQLAAWVTSHRETSDTIRESVKTRDALRARIIERIGDASRIELRDYTISASTVKEAIVETYTRAAHRALRITTRKEKAA